MSDRKNDTNETANILVIGVGGSGHHTINQMAEETRQGAGTKLVCIDTDPQQATEKSREELTALVKDADMVFVTCGMDEETGAGVAPVVAGIARENGILTAGIVTTPASFQTEAQRDQILRGVERLREAADTLIVIPAGDPQKAEDTLRQGVRCLTDLVNVPANIMDLDFADLQEAMQGRGIAHMGMGSGSGDEKCLHAVRQAFQSSPLETAIRRASHVILDIAGDATLTEVTTAADFVQKLAGKTATVLPRFLYDNGRPDSVTVTVIATGLGETLEA